MIALIRTAELQDALDVFWHAHEAAEDAREGLTRRQEAGLDEHAEFLFAEADARYGALLKLAGLDERVGRLTEQEFGQDVSADYVSRRPVRVVNKAEPLTADWRESERFVDWARGAA
jgi:hypothetical protein